MTIHFVKENAIVSKASRSSEKFMHGIKVLMAKNYVDNLSEEVKKGLREKAEQGHWPTVAPVGYVNNRATRRIDVDPVRGPLVATGLRAVRDRVSTRSQALAAKAQRDRPHPPRSAPADDQGRNPSDAAEPDLHRRLPLARQAASRARTTPLISRELFDAVQAVLGAEAARAATANSGTPSWVC